MLNSEFPFIEVSVNDQNSKLSQVQDLINITLVVINA